MAKHDDIPGMLGFVDQTAAMADLARERDEALAERDDLRERADFYMAERDEADGERAIITAHAQTLADDLAAARAEVASLREQLERERHDADRRFSREADAHIQKIEQHNRLRSEVANIASAAEGVRDVHPQFAVDLRAALDADADATRRADDAFAVAVRAQDRAAGESIAERAGEPS